jgi:type I restriction enzyme S subunit
MFEPKPLGEAIAFHTGGGTPSRQVPSYWGGGIPWASVKDFTDDAEQISATQETISQKGLNASASNLIPPGTPLVCTRMAVGRAAMPTVPMAINQDVKALYPAPGVTPAYLLAVLQYTQRFAEAQSIGSTVKGIRIQDYLAIPVPQAPEVEQPTIAEILATLNTAIHQTEAIVEKLKQVKQGLLHDLLTRGVDANGELRPSYEQAPHLYQESPLGWVPKDWEIVTLGQIAARSSGILQTGPFGSQLHAHEYVVDGVPVVMPQDMVNGRLSVQQIARITTRKAVALSRHRLIPNDIVFSRRGDLSRCVAIEDEHTGWLCGTGCLLARFPEKEINGFWLSLVYQQPGVQSQVLGRAVGSTMANLNTSILAELAIARPVVDEQNEITLRLKATTQRVNQELADLAKLRQQKIGLMDDLLTGRVRVTRLLAQ